MAISYHHDPLRAVVRIEGADAFSFFQGYTTQDTQSLSPGRATRAIVTTRKGSMMDWVLVLRDETGLTLLGGADRGQALATVLDRYTLGVDVTITDRSQDLAVLELLGATPSTLIGGPTVDQEGGPGATSPDLTIRDASASQWPFWTLASGGWWAPVHPALPEASLLVVAAADANSWEKRLAAAGAAKWDSATFEAWRIQQGLPGSGCEIREDVNPWEARLGGSVSLDKGCYLGQEVVARLLNYQKVQRHLMGLTWSKEAALEAGMPVRVNDTTIGTITSVSNGTGLALVKVAHAVAGTPVRLGEQDIEATLDSRPFWTAQAHEGIRPPR